MPPPDRWENYQPIGSVIPGTKFIAFKVPLKQDICKNLPEIERFSPELLVQTVKDSGKNLGLVVDLTFTYKYYDGKCFTKRDIQYEKIFTKGHEVPSDDVVQRFLDIIDDFSLRNPEEDVLIGVHCTHGINRTGYLVCRYMIEKLDIDPDEAISLFGKARGHPIERENYIHDLKYRAGKFWDEPRRISSGKDTQGGGGGGEKQSRRKKHKKDRPQSSSSPRHTSDQPTHRWSSPHNSFSSYQDHYNGGGSRFHWRMPGSTSHNHRYSGVVQGAGYVQRPALELGRQGYPCQTHPRYSWRMDSHGRYRNHLDAHRYSNNGCYPARSQGFNGYQGYSHQGYAWHQGGDQSSWGSPRVDWYGGQGSGGDGDGSDCADRRGQSMQPYKDCNRANAWTS